MEINHDISKKLWDVAYAALTNVNVIKLKKMSFCKFAEICKEADPEIAIASDLEEVNIYAHMFYLMLTDWMYMYNCNAFSRLKAEHHMWCYHFICKLFEEEDFVALLGGEVGVMNAVLSLKAEEVNCLHYHPHGSALSEYFNRIYSAIARRTSMSLKEEGKHGRLRRH